MCGWQIKLCDPLVTRRSCISERFRDKERIIKRYINSPSFYSAVSATAELLVKLCAGELIYINGQKLSVCLCLNLSDPNHNRCTSCMELRAPTTDIPLRDIPPPPHIPPSP